MGRIYQECADCGNDTFQVYKEDDGSPGTIEECYECGSGRIKFKD